MLNRRSFISRIVGTIALASTYCGFEPKLQAKEIQAKEPEPIPTQLQPSNWTTQTWESFVQDFQKKYQR